jgi:preprotein translocase subunit SecD
MTVSDHKFNEIAAGKVKPKREAPFSLRLTFAEKAALRDLAGEMPLGAYIKAVLSDAIQNKKKIAPRTDPEALGRVLGQLGKSKLSQNVNQLAKAVNVGALPVTPETESELRQACADIAAMRQELMRALKDGGPS